MENVHKIQKQINEAASAGNPFLFGIDFEMENGFFVDNPLQQTDILWRVGEATNFTPQAIPAKEHFTPVYNEYADYAAKYDIVYNGLQRGDTFLINLTAKTRIETGYTLEQILKASNSPYAILVPDKFVCFSPETFVKIDTSGIISSYPMKGTIDARHPDAEQTILSDYKETSEHYTIVDLIRSDLSRVASQINVPKMRYIDRLETSSGEILQVSSQVQGQLPGDYKTHLGDILMELLPAGSISGAPKPGTVGLIRKAEGEKRGYYCGIFGYFDGETLDSAVAIRYIENENGTLYFRSGSGITINSDCRYEYDEVNQKIYLPFV